MLMPVAMVAVGALMAVQASDVMAVGVCTRGSEVRGEADFYRQSRSLRLSKNV